MSKKNLCKILLSRSKRANGPGPATIGTLSDSIIKDLVERRSDHFQEPHGQIWTNIAESMAELLSAEPTFLSNGQSSAPSSP